MPNATNAMQESTDSNGSEQLVALKAQIFKAMVNNDARLQFLREEITSGRYQVQSQSIAARLVAHHNQIEEPELVS